MAKEPKAHKEMQHHHKEMMKHHERELKHHMKEHAKHSDLAEDKALIRKEVKKSALKK